MFSRVITRSKFMNLLQLRCLFFFQPRFTFVKEINMLQKDLLAKPLWFRPFSNNPGDNLLSGSWCKHKVLQKWHHRKFCCTPQLLPELIQDLNWSNDPGRFWKFFWKWGQNTSFTKDELASFENGFNCAPNLSISVCSNNLTGLVTGWRT